jgi:hypothetical protein
MVAVPAALGMKSTFATPLTGVTGVAGVNAPVTPVTLNVTALVAFVTVFPRESWMVALNVRGTPVCVDALAGESWIFAGAPGVTVTVDVTAASVPDVTVTTMVPVTGGVKLVVATPLIGMIGEGGENSEASPAVTFAVNVTASVALVTVLPAASWIVAV